MAIVTLDTQHRDRSLKEQVYLQVKRRFEELKAKKEEGDPVDHTADGELDLLEIT